MIVIILTVFVLYVAHLLLFIIIDEILHVFGILASVLKSVPFFQILFSISILSALTYLLVSHCFIYPVFIIVLFLFFQKSRDNVSQIQFKCFISN